MKHLSSILLAAAFVAAGATACFDDPTSDLQNGPAQIQMDRSAVTLRTGDSIRVRAEVKDDAGNVFDAGDATWESADPTVATATKDTAFVPGGAFTRAYVKGIAPLGGITTITMNSRGVTKTLRALVLPARLSPSAPPAPSGSSVDDTIVVALPGGGTSEDVFTAQDTVTFTVAAGSRTFFTDTSHVLFGAAEGYVIGRTDSTALKVIVRQPFRGVPWVYHMYWIGNADVGVVVLDSLQSDDMVVARPRLHDAISVVGDTLVVNAPSGATFDPAASVIRFDSTNGIMLSRTTTQLRAISPVDYTGIIAATNVHVGLATVDSLKSMGSYTIARATFGGTVLTGGRLLDTLKVYATAVAKFTITPDTLLSDVLVGDTAAWVLLRTADSMYVIPKLPSSGPVAISNVDVGGTIIARLNSADDVVITETPTGEANEPANDAPDAVALAIDWATVTQANPFVLYGAIADAGDVDDLFAITLTATRTVRIRLQFVGTGYNGTAADPDLDLLVCNAGCSAWVSTSGATSAQPENITLTSQAAGTYNIYVNGYATGGTTRPYRLLVW